MSFRPFTMMGERIDESLKEYALGVGAITIGWAHLELALDITIAVNEHFMGTSKRTRHPIGMAAKIGRLTGALKMKAPHIEPYKLEILQIMSLSQVASKERNLLVHGALFSTLTEAEIDLMKVTRQTDDDDIENAKTSLHQMFVVMEMIFEITVHIYNVVIRMLQDHLEGYDAEIERLALIDVSKFTWPAINRQTEK